MGCYSYCAKCGCGQDAPTIEEVAYTSMTCDCGEPRRFDIEREGFAMIAEAIGDLSEKISKITDKMNKICDRIEIQKLSD